MRSYFDTKFRGSVCHLLALSYLLLMLPLGWGVAVECGDHTLHVLKRGCHIQEIEVAQKPRFLTTVDGH